MAKITISPLVGKQVKIKNGLFKNDIATVAFSYHQIYGKRELIGSPKDTYGLVFNQYGNVAWFEETELIIQNEN